jgi:hypothetical protein
MTGPSKTSVFLARNAYHKRRMRDLARAVPLFGAVLLSIPLLWPRGEDGAANSDAVVYIFVVWSVLILAAAGISRAVKSDEPPPAPRDQS